MSTNDVDLKTLREQINKKKEEIKVTEKEYKHAKYGADVNLIMNAMLDNCLDSFETFGGMTMTNKKKIAEMFAEMFAEKFAKHSRQHSLISYRATRYRRYLPSRKRSVTG